MVRTTHSKGPAHERITRYADNLLQRVSPANRPFVADFAQLRRNEGLSGKSVYTYIQSMRHFDAFLKGRPFASASRKECMDYVTHLRGTMKDSTIFRLVFALRRCMRDLLQVDELPKEIDQALYVRSEREDPLGRLLTDTDLHKLLQATLSLKGRYETICRVEKSQAILWTLWDSGFRAAELLSLNVGDVRFEDHRGAQLALRPEAESLKTGARTIYVSECVGPLRAWIDMHPASEDATAPLFPSWQDRTGLKRMDYQMLLLHLKMLSDRSGVNAESSRGKKVSPHDFRHTCATRKAKAGWMEAQLRAYFGWAAGSVMPALYVHLALGDMRDRVRRDAGLDETGYQNAVERGDVATQFALLMKQLQEQALGASPAKTTKPSEWSIR